MYLLPKDFNQKGFAAIPILILLLFGIAAGTLLVQNGVNFLPKAADNFTYHCDGNTLRSDVGFYAQDCKNQICKESNGTASCIDNPANPTDTFATYCDGATVRFSADNGAKEDCKARGENYLCRETKPGEASCVYSPTNINQTHCGSNNEVRNQNGQATDNCTNQGKVCIKLNSSEARCIPPRNLNDCAIYGDDYTININTGLCTTILEGDRQSLADRQPLAANPGNCSPEKAKECKNGCYKDYGGVDRCLLANGDCSAEQKKKCKEIGMDENLCQIIGGEHRCLYPSKDSTPNAKDCGCSDCKVVERSGKFVAGCPASTCSQGWHNFCLATEKKSCVIEQGSGVPACTGDPAAAPAQLGPAAAAPGARQAAGAPTAAAARPAPAGGPSQCVGFTRDLVCVPAYQVGVFSSYDQLLATEAQAKVASERYDKTVATLDLIKGKIKSEQAKAAEEAARAKLKAAQDAAKACLAQTTK